MKRIRTFAAKAEATIGTAESLTAAEGVFNAYDLIIQAVPTFEQREAQGQFGVLSAVPGPLAGKATFKTDLAYDDTNIPPYASVLLPMCGYVNSAGTFTPRSEAPGTNVKTGTIGCFQNGLLKSIAGAVGTFKIVFPTGKMAYIEWEFTGVWQAPTDTAIIAPTYPTISPVKAANMTTTFNSASFCSENITFDAGNKISLLQCQTGNGYKSALIVDRAPMATSNPESVLNATQNRWAPLTTAAEQALNLTVGAAITISAPKAQIVDNQEGDRESVLIDNLKWQINKNGDNLDQDVSIVFS
jgi:hypothetical protein